MQYFSEKSMKWFSDAGDQDASLFLLTCLLLWDRCSLHTCRFVAKLILSASLVAQIQTFKHCWHKSRPKPNTAALSDDTEAIFLLTLLLSSDKTRKISLWHLIWSSQEDRKPSGLLSSCGEGRKIWICTEIQQYGSLMSADNCVPDVLTYHSIKQSW